MTFPECLKKSLITGPPRFWEKSTSTTTRALGFHLMENRTARSSSYGWGKAPLLSLVVEIR
jgi:hypothetical protein